MMMASVEIRWEPVPGNPSDVRYYVDDSPVGEGDAGFDAVLSTLRSRTDSDVVLKVERQSSLGGDDLIDTLPFGKRFNELREAAGDARILYAFS